MKNIFTFGSFIGILNEEMGPFNPEAAKKSSAEIMKSKGGSETDKSKTGLSFPNIKSVFGKEHNPLWQNIVDYQTSLDSQINVIKIVKIKERAHTVKIQDQLNSAIKKCAKYFLDIIPIEESKKLKVILDDIIESLTKI